MINLSLTGKNANQTDQAELQLTQGKAEVIVYKPIEGVPHASTWNIV